MIFALMMIFGYVMFRFQWKFAAGAVAALAHDVIVTVGFFSIFGLPFDLTVVAAVLAVIGYSLNDTVVTFDRVRENFLKLRGIEAFESMNISVNEMLARTLITGITTLLVLVALLTLGGGIDRAVLDRTDRRHHHWNVLVDLHGVGNRLVAGRESAGPDRAGQGPGPDRRSAVGGSAVRVVCERRLDFPRAQFGNRRVDLRRAAQYLAAVEIVLAAVEPGDNAAGFANDQASGRQVPGL